LYLDPNTIAQVVTVLTLREKNKVCFQHNRNYLHLDQQKNTTMTAAKSLRSIGLENLNFKIENMMT